MYGRVRPLNGWLTYRGTVRFDWFVGLALWLS